MADFVSRLRLVVDSTGTDRAGRKMKNLRRETDGAKRAAMQLRTAYAALGAVVGGLVSARLLQGFNEQARAVAKVEQAIKSTGGAANLTSKELQRVAANLQKITTFGDEQILNEVTAQLLTFTNIANEEFTRTQQVALDLATVLDGDLKSASIQLGKALNDPVKNLSALSRSGIQFTKEQENLIKTLFEAGRIAEAQGVILDELERQYGGQAEAAAAVGTGLLTQLQNVVGDIGELLGERLFNFIAPAIREIKAFLEIDENQAKVVDVITGLGVALAAITIPPALALLPGLLAAIASPAALAVGAITGLVVFRDEIAQAVFGVEDFGSVVDAVIPVVERRFSILQDRVLAFKMQLDNAALSFVQFFKPSIEENAFEEIVGFINQVIDFVNRGLEQLQNLIIRILRAISDAVLAAVSLLADGVAAIASFAENLPGFGERAKELNALAEAMEKFVEASKIPEDGGILGDIIKFSPLKFVIDEGKKALNDINAEIDKQKASQREIEQIEGRILQKKNKTPNKRKTNRRGKSASSGIARASRPRIFNRGGATKRTARAHRPRNSRFATPD